MARRPARRPPQRPRPDDGAPHPPISDRDKIIEAFFALLAEQAFEDIGYASDCNPCGPLAARTRFDRFWTTRSLMSSIFTIRFL